MQLNTIAQAREYATDLHDKANKKYGGYLPYSYHLEKVEFFVCYFAHLLRSLEGTTMVRKAAWLHDTIEDCGVTYNDIAFKFGKPIADLVYNVTNELGKNRKERHEKTLPKLKSDPVAIFLKLCDRLANTLYSKYSGSTMYEKYVAEWPEFKEHLYREEYKEMFDYYENLINLK